MNTNQPNSPQCGSIDSGGKKLELYSHFIYSNGKTAQVQIVFFPFPLSIPDKDVLKNKPAVFLAMDKPSPDKRFWNCCPYAELALTFKDGSAFISIETLQELSLHLTWFNGMNSTVFVIKPREQISAAEFRTLSGSLEPGADLSLSYEFAGSINDQPFRITLSARGSIESVNY